MIIKNKILRVTVLIAYLGLLAISNLHVHNHYCYAGSTYLTTPKSITEKDPFADSDSVCSLVVFSQTSYVTSTQIALYDVAQHSTTNKHFYYTTSFESFVGLHNNLRAPPSLS